jgi:hypothetical protein
MEKEGIRKYLRLSLTFLWAAYASLCIVGIFTGLPSPYVRILIKSLRLRSYWIQFRPLDHALLSNQASFYQILGVRCSMSNNISLNI